MDKMDGLFLALGYGKEENASYVRGRHNRRPMNLPYKQEVVGSSPIAPTELDPSQTAFGTGRAVSCYAPL